MRVAGKLLHAPALIRIHNQLGIGARAANFAQACNVSQHAFATAQLDFQQWKGARLRGCMGHRVSPVQNHGEGGCQRAWARHLGELPDRFAGRFGFQIPQRAIERTPRRAGRQRGLQIGARHARAYGPAQLLDGRGNGFNRLAIAGIGQCFTTPAHAAIGYFHTNRLGAHLAPFLRYSAL